MMRITRLTLLFSAVLPISSFVMAQENPKLEERQQRQEQKTFQAYIPKKYTFFEVVKGDLNKDGIEGAVLLVKGINPKAKIKDEYRGILDRNRRGLIVLLGQKDNNSYQPVIWNLNCFSSDQEDGGVYYPPELVPEIKNGLLQINYQHGRYGHWSYKFRFENRDMRLIGYDAFLHQGPLLESKVSINFLSAKKIYSKNLNTEIEAKPKFKETVSRIKQAPVYLSKIKDFDELTF